MIDNFHVKNYRGFPSYSVEGLNRVNVFVGRNNAGKTSMLEALHLFTSNAPMDVVQGISRRRGEQSVETTTIPQGVRILPDLKHFFYGHRILPDVTLEMGTASKSFSLRLTKKVEDEHLMNEGTLQMLRNRNAVVLSLYQRSGSSAAKEVGVISIAPDGEVSEYRKHSPNIDKDVVPASVFVSPESADYAFLSKLWNGVLARGDEQSIVEALKILNKGLKSLAFLLFDPNAIRAFTASIPGIVVGMDGFEGQRLPLGSLGDGSRRLLAVALALSAAKNGYLFIDEIDVGLHYSAMTKLWELILDSAMRNNIQVFASTHSIDCLRGLKNSIENNADRRNAVALHAVVSGSTVSTRYSGNEIMTAIRQEIEVR